VVADGIIGLLTVFFLVGLAIAPFGGLLIEAEARAHCPPNVCTAIEVTLRNHRPIADDLGQSAESPQKVVQRVRRRITPR
jgi:hypothetical protein